MVGHGCAFIKTWTGAEWLPYCKRRAMALKRMNQGLSHENGDSAFQNETP
jgi:hypothetical protein